MKQKTKIGRFFTLEEFCDSAKARELKIDNLPNEQELENIKLLVKEVLDPVRHIMNSEIIITSGFRCAELNKEVGGVATSQHVLGEAADIFNPKIKELFDLIQGSFVYDQVILESKDTKKGKVFWVHVSFKEGHNRGESFHMHNGARTTPKTINKKWN